MLACKIEQRFALSASVQATGLAGPSPEETRPASRPADPQQRFHAVRAADNVGDVLLRLARPAGLMYFCLEHLAVQRHHAQAVPANRDWRRRRTGSNRRWIFAGLRLIEKLRGTLGDALFQAGVKLANFLIGFLALAVTSRMAAVTSNPSSVSSGLKLISTGNSVPSLRTRE